MTTEAEKHTLLEEFRNYLEQSKLEQFGTIEQPDLNTLLSEMAGLKAEVKAESRQFKNTLDTLNTALTALQSDNRILSDELALYSERLEQQRHEITRTMLLDIVDIYDRLCNSLEIVENYRPISALFKHSRREDVRFINQFKDGQGMTVRRFAQSLQRYEVREIDCVGKLFEPSTMHAVETGHDPKHANGIVLEQLRRGFLFGDQVLRLAEVKVNKINAR